jgi:drug/metabolite transporter (DMT)-like permease
VTERETWLGRRLPALWPGGAFGLASAGLFGASVVAAKALLGAIEPLMLAGLLYLGSGAGLLVVRTLARRRPRDRREAGLAQSDWLWLGLAVASGGVIAPALLMWGLAATPGSAASLLLILEGVFTAVLAWSIFREHFSPRIGAGMAAVAGGAACLMWTDSPELAGAAGPALILAACLAWAADNNLTQKVSLGDPLQIAMLKGLVAGTTNVALALSLGQPLPPPSALALAAIAGFAGYGVSLVLFVLALRHIGAARTAAYFSTAPFVGAVLAVIFLGDAVTIQVTAAAALMGIGVWLHLSERHDHEHKHEALAHAHRHRHDDHHRHAHAAGDPPGEPHTHRHVHEPIEHAHPHYPDSHHRHAHPAD